jgi:hypothetical protein
VCQQSESEEAALPTEHPEFGGVTSSSKKEGVGLVRQQSESEEAGHRPNLAEVAHNSACMARLTWQRSGS